jgi:translation initiation factor 3 subunit I
MKPIILQGHSRPIKDLKFNKDGDLLFSASNDRYITLWASETGERIGTFFHSAAVNTMSITSDAKILVSGDNTGGCYFWEINTGALLKKIDMDPTFSVRSADLSYGEQMVAISYSGRMKESKSQIDVYNLSEILSAPSDSKSIITALKPLKSFSPSGSKYVMSKWINLNTNLLSTREDGVLELMNYQTGDIVKQAQVHKETIMDFDVSKKEEVIITASKDGKSCIIDPDSFDVIHTLYPQDPTRNLNSCKISPLFSLGNEEEEKYHAIVAGGQESRDVTTTHAKKGGFEVLFYNVMYGEELGAVQGHFGPVNTLCFGPNGRLVASGAEDATIRLHKLEEDYINLG